MLPVSGIEADCDCLDFDIVIAKSGDGCIFHQFSQLGGLDLDGSLEES